jgi:CO/xanthine dehydrogenase Mo-binding subunit
VRRVADATWPADALQLLGEAVLVVAARQAHQIEPAARRCATELRERDWGGDAELADQIDAALAWGPPSALRLVGSR